ncbi:MAG: wax ester/triacylglycerol synthase domain-containing protein, partial [Ilumatobacteraceae bacterium]
LDRPPDFERLLRTMDRATNTFRRLRQRVQVAPANISAPMWVDDSDFDLRRHVRHIALPKPGSMRQLLDLASLIACDPFDRTRPLWQFVVIDGLRGGKSAFIQKMHHTIIDGEGGMRLSLQYIDIERDAPEKPAVTLPAEEELAGAEAEHSTVANDLLRSMVAGSLRLPLGVVRQIRDLLADPTGMAQAGNTAADAVRGVISQLSDTDKAHSPLWTARSLGRRMEVLRAPFRDTRDAARRLGGTLNTAFLTAAADAAGRYHDELGQPVETLRASMAISTRTATSGSNAFSLARMLVPTAAMPIAERFAMIQASSEAARQSSGGASLDTLAAVATALPTSLITRLARQQAQTVDFATSNVRGAPVPMYLAGAELLENYPVGPLAGVAYNLTLLSYNNSLDMGVNIDTAAVTEPELLTRLLNQAFRDLLSA